MNFFDRMAAAIMPEESDEDRERARNETLALADEGSWLHTVIDQHRQIEAMFDEARMAQSSAEREMAARRLAQLLSAHSMAEETVLYPAIARGGHKGHAAMAYEEQSMTKIELAALEQLDPESEEWQDKLEHIRKAVAHHVYEEESEWFRELHRSAEGSEAQMLNQRFEEEFSRHGDVGHGAMGGMRQSGVSQSGMGQSGMNQSGVLSENWQSGPNSGGTTY